jgi:hypothetical protein
MHFRKEVGVSLFPALGPLELKKAHIRKGSDYGYGAVEAPIIYEAG